MLLVRRRIHPLTSPITVALSTWTSRNTLGTVPRLPRCPTPKATAAISTAHPSARGTARLPSTPTSTVSRNPRKSSSSQTVGPSRPCTSLVWTSLPVGSVPAPCPRPSGCPDGQHDDGDAAAHEHQPAGEDDRGGGAEPWQSGAGSHRRVHAGAPVRSHDDGDVAAGLGLDIELGRTGPGGRGEPDARLGGRDGRRTAVDVAVEDAAGPPGQRDAVEILHRVLLGRDADEELALADGLQPQVPQPLVEPGTLEDHLVADRRVPGGVDVPGRRHHVTVLAEGRLPGDERDAADDAEETEQHGHRAGHDRDDAARRPR